MTDDVLTHFPHAVALSISLHGHLEWLTRTGASEAPAVMPLDANDNERRTSHLSLNRSASYSNLLDFLWMFDSLPKDDASLAKIANVSLRWWRAIKASLMRAFDAGEDGQWHHWPLERSRAVLIRLRQAYRRDGALPRDLEALAAIAEVTPASLDWMAAHGVLTCIFDWTEKGGVESDLTDWADYAADVAGGRAKLFTALPDGSWTVETLMRRRQAALEYSAARKRGEA